jgi:flagellin
MLSIRTNVAAFNAQRQMGTVSNMLDRSMERLSSGFRVNRAADDAAGLAISEKLKAQVRGLLQASRNSSDGISMIQTAEAGLDQIQNMLQRVRELAVQAANDTLGADERTGINNEIQQLRQEVQSISERTKFNGLGLLNGSLMTQVDTAASGVLVGLDLPTGTATVSAVNVQAAKSGKQYDITYAAGTNTLTLTDSTDATKTQDVVIADVAANTASTISFSQFAISLTVVAGNALVDADDIGADLVTAAQITTDSTTSSAVLQSGANSGEETTVSFLDTRIDDSTDFTALKAALDTFNVLGTRTQATASALISEVDTALNTISTKRAELGASQNRLEYSIANVKAGAENLSASNSRIRDVDVAEESSAMAKAQILLQAGVSVLSQANQIPQLALKLLG